MQGAPMSKVNRLAAVLRAIGSLVGASGTLVRQIINSGSKWRSTIDPLVGHEWIPGNFSDAGDPATAPNPNPFTTPNDLVPIPRHNKMRTCGPGGALCNNSDTNGPPEVFFGMSLDLKPNSVVRLGTARIIADDYFEFIVNGQ